MGFKIHCGSLYYTIRPSALCQSILLLLSKKENTPNSYDVTIITQNSPKVVQPMSQFNASFSSLERYICRTCQHFISLRLMARDCIIHFLWRVKLAGIWNELTTVYATVLFCPFKHLQSFQEPHVVDRQKRERKHFLSVGLMGQSFFTAMYTTNELLCMWYSIYYVLLHVPEKKMSI